MMQKSNWDIFCKVVDNFGDIGVCWRLAQQLHHGHGISVRLWVDDLLVAQRLIPTLDTALSTQTAEDILVSRWDENADFSQAAEFVIEAFACGLPASYLATMQTQSSKWINLEYLSAEPWVQDFHAKPSPQPNGLIRHFYFPGFTEKTGGLLGIGARANNHTLFNTPSSALKISLFCYPHATISRLLHVMANGEVSIHCYVPNTNVLNQVASYFGLEYLQVGQVIQSAQLTVEVLPFLSQADYDALLAHCDINFVRGEDSWIRAIWAGQAFIWQPYLQAQEAHIQKLSAFLTQFYTDTAADTFAVIQILHDQWANGNIEADTWYAYLAKLRVIKSLTETASLALRQQPDLASKLVIFCNNL